MARLEIKLEEPDAGEELEIIEVSAELGASVAQGDELIEVATDKANMVVSAPSDGTVIELPVAEGDVVAPDAVLVVLETS